MMLVMLLSSLLNIAAVLATASMIVTWWRYAGAWAAVDAQLRGLEAVPGQLVPGPLVMLRVESVGRNAAG